MFLIGDCAGNPQLGQDHQDTDFLGSAAEQISVAIDSFESFLSQVPAGLGTGRFWALCGGVKQGGQRE
jgi:hypothetical protein